jgi:hypothetical protein
MISSPELHQSSFKRMKARSRPCRDLLSDKETRRFFPIRGECQAVKYIVENSCDSRSGWTVPAC